ncbi:hypothetical protein [Aminobacter sp. MDW-2]|jgi:uncharacterized protein YjiS (DUF1127 family)|uniref:hypothetical protein n=1 Tax=Aminobacter TaxID=31988 RepID=UPI00163C6BBF|nr:hypothetical protein [Aminobacter sp. MDW-2]QNH36676.1 hypothetical protein H5P29_12685 [Aminobacter sp. MDW-2]
MTTMIDNQGKTAHRGRQSFALLARAVLASVRSAASALGEWRAARSLSRLDDATLKDLCIPRGNIDWLVRERTDGGRAMNDRASDEK